MTRSGTGSYDDLGEHEQAIVREEWSERMTARRTALDYAAQFAESHDAYSELDQDGNVVIRSDG